MCGDKSKRAANRAKGERKMCGLIGLKTWNLSVAFAVLMLELTGLFIFQLGMIQAQTEEERWHGSEVDRLRFETVLYVLAGIFFFISYACVVSKFVFELREYTYGKAVSYTYLVVLTIGFACFFASLTIRWVLDSSKISSFSGGFEGPFSFERLAQILQVDTVVLYVVAWKEKLSGLPVMNQHSLFLWEPEHLSRPAEDEEVDGSDEEAEAEAGVGAGHNHRAATPHEETSLINATRGHGGGGHGGHGGGHVGHEELVKAWRQQKVSVCGKKLTYARIQVLAVRFVSVLCVACVICYLVFFSAHDDETVTLTMTACTSTAAGLTTCLGSCPYTAGCTCLSDASAASFTIGDGATDPSTLPLWFNATVPGIGNATRTFGVHIEAAADGELEFVFDQVTCVNATAAGCEATHVSLEAGEQESCGHFPVRVDVYGEASLATTLYYSVSTGDDENESDDDDL